MINRDKMPCNDGPAYGLLFAYINITYRLSFSANLIIGGWSMADEWFTAVQVLRLAPLRLIRDVYFVVWMNMLRKIDRKGTLNCVRLDWYMHSAYGKITNLPDSDFHVCWRVGLLIMTETGRRTSYDAILFMVPESKFHGANMRPIWVRQDPVGPMLAPWTLLSGILNI